MSRLALVTILLLATTAHADPEAPVGEPEGLPLRYELGRTLFGVKIGVAPGVLVTRLSPKPGGYAGYVKIELLRGLVILRTDVMTVPDQPTYWAFDLHLGGELRPASIAGTILRPVLRPMRKLVKRAL